MVQLECEGAYNFNTLIFTHFCKQYFNSKTDLYLKYDTYNNTITKVTSRKYSSETDNNKQNIQKLSNIYSGIYKVIKYIKPKQDRADGHLIQSKYTLIRASEFS
jgi:hypothetical protein